MNKYNNLFIIGITTLYIFLILKISELVANSYQDEDEMYQKYGMTIFIISLLGITIGYLYIKENENNGNYIIKNSLNYGGLLMLLYSMINYWDYLDESAKIIIIGMGLSYLIYYSYNL
jgi:predicted transporter